MAVPLSRSTWATFSVFHKRWPFLAQNVFISDLLVQIRNQCLDVKIDLCAKFQPDQTEYKGVQIMTWNDTLKCLMMS